MFTPFLKVFCGPGKQTGSHKSCLPLKKLAEKRGDVLIHLEDSPSQMWRSVKVTNK